MRRALVLTTESARHPFRVNLPQPQLVRDRERATALLFSAVKTWFACFAATIIFLS
jgi:hypothetical protein